MTTHARSRTEAALAEEAGAVDDLCLSAAQQAMSSRRQPPASVSQFRSFTARSPRPVSSTPRRRAFVVLQTLFTKDPLPVIGSPTIVTPAQIVTSLVVTSGSAPKTMVLVMTQTTPATTVRMTTTTMRISSTLLKN